MSDEQAVTTERRGHVLLMGLNRPAKRNAFTLAMFEQLALAYGELERDPELRCGVLFAHGEHFTGGLDLAQVAPAVIDGGGLPVPEGGRQPWRLAARPRRSRSSRPTPSRSSEARRRGGHRSSNAGRRGSRGVSSPSLDALPFPAVKPMAGDGHCEEPGSPGSFR